MFNLVKVKLKFSKLLTIITPTTTVVGIWNRIESVGNPASGSLNGSLNGAYYIASFMPHIIKQASTTHNFQLICVSILRYLSNRRLSGRRSPIS